MNQRGRQRARASAAGIAALLASVLLSFVWTTVSSAASPHTPDVTGEWAAPFDLGVVAVNGTLMPNGKVLLYSDPNAHIGSEAHVWDPADDSNVDIGFSIPRNLFCSGQIVTADGRVLAVGGERFGFTMTGTRQTTFMDPATNTWSDGPHLIKSRWYPTPVELATGRLLVFGGQANKDLVHRSVETLNPAATAFTVLPHTADRTVGLYPAMHLLPTGKIFNSVSEGPTEGQHPGIFSPKTNSWRAIDALMSGRRFFSTSVLLPGLHEILVAGGSTSLHGKTGVGLDSAEIFDLGSMMPMWKETDPMQFARRDANAVLTADGKVLMVGGGGTGFYGDPVYEAESFDPVTDTWTTMAAQQAPRMHHSVALLLPDGRVLSTGQTGGTMGNTGEIFSPPYLFQGARPAISSVAAQVGYGQPLQIQTSDAADISRVALVRPGSTSHGVNFEQRYVDLAYTEGVGVIDATSPATGNIAPPGWYMLFILNEAGVPSVASWVHVS